MARELDLGGTERQLALVAKNLNRLKFEPHVAAFTPEGIRADELRAAGVPVTGFPVRSFRSISGLRGARAMGAYLHRHRIQLVHTFDVPANIFGVPVARAYRVPHVLSSQRAYRSLTPGIYHRILKVTDKLADGIVVNSANLCDALVREDAVPRGKLHLCYNGLDTTVFTPPPGG